MLCFSFKSQHKMPIFSIVLSLIPQHLLVVITFSLMSLFLKTKVCAALKITDTSFVEFRFRILIRALHSSIYLTYIPWSTPCNYVKLNY